MERRNAWLSYKEADENEMEKLNRAYREFLNKGKTERECVTEIVKQAEAAGYEALEARSPEETRSRLAIRFMQLV